MHYSIIQYLFYFIFVFLFFFFTEDWLPGSLTVLSREYWCHHADYQSDPKGQQLLSFCALYNGLLSVCILFLSYGLLLFSPLSFSGSQQSQPVWHRCCPHWPLLFCHPWSGSRFGQWHHDTGELWIMGQEVYNKNFYVFSSFFLLQPPTFTLPMSLFI